MPYALIFPGQGAQEVGMGRDFYDSSEIARSVFEEADASLGFSLSKVIFEGPEDELTKTSITQPAILTTSIAIMRTIESEFDEPPAMAAGHSLGEYTALVAAGVLSLSDAVKLVHERGRLMQEAVPLGVGAMSAVLGLSLDDIAGVCRDAAQGGVCSPANVNAPNQIVISGEAEAVARAGELAKERGASKVIPLKVSAPFHCELMRPVADKLAAAFESCAWNAPKFPIVANVDASLLRNVDAIKSAIYSQTFSPVLWSQDVLAMDAAGVDTFYEMGPGNVLTGLIKRICKGKVLFALKDAESASKAVAALREAKS